MKEKFYLTTAIAYTSSKPHIGNVYESILSDAIVRFKKKEGYDVYFQTGTDEHGQKIENKAKSLGITPKEHVDNISNQIKDVYKMMNIDYDHFIRTTDPYHEREVQKIFRYLFEKGDIYKGFYEGYYCVDCESYFTEKDLVDGCCPDCGAKVTRNKEECYFFKLTPYQDRLVEYIKAHDDFIQPESRKNEMLNNFLAKPLPDLCVSRTSYKWGIPVDFDPKHVIYVWIDALANYITGIGYHFNEQSEPLFVKNWPADVHIIGKDILRFHTIYWPIMLMALDLPLPKQIFAHPWILMNHNKMSKSKGNVIYPNELIDLFGVDAVRYYCLHEIPYAQDGNLTYELVCEKNNSDLANTLGNLVNRTMAMAKKYFDSKVVISSTKTEFDASLEEMTNNLCEYMINLMKDYHVADAIDEVLKVLRRANKYVDETMPWALAKDEAKKEELMDVMYHLLEAIRVCAIMLEPFIPDTSKKIYQMLNINSTTFEDAKFGVVKEFNVGEAVMLFKRLDVNKDVLDVVHAREEAENTKQEEANNLITIDDFDKVEMVVGKIIEADKHPKADKLLVFKVDIGSEVRQIVSGIAKFYNPSDLVGKKVVVVKNLKPVVLRGVESQGMLLCASDEEDKKLELLNVSSLNPGDHIS